MATPYGASWVTELGLDRRRPPAFFRRASELDELSQPAPQAHAMRRAFALLELDGILCLANAPAVYFKEVERADPSLLCALQRRVWSQGIAPVLVVIDPRAVHIYSGLALPARPGEDVRGGGRWVDTLDRAAQGVAIRQALLGVETGEFFRAHAASFDPERRVDRQLLESLGEARRALAAAAAPGVNPRVADALLCRLVLTFYLVGRRILDEAHFAEAGAPGATTLLDLLEGRPAAEGRRLLYALFRRLQRDFNGDLFEGDIDAEAAQVSDGHIEVLCRLLRGEDLAKGQLAPGFWAYDWSVLPASVISAIYEGFYRAGDERGPRTTGTYYTPRLLAEVVLDTALDGLGSLLDRRYLDPACGSGVLLVSLFHRLAEAWRRLHPGAHYDEHADALITILRGRLFGVDNNLTACKVAAFSLYVALLEELDPPAIRRLSARGRSLPRLVIRAPVAAGEASAARGGTIAHADFAAIEAPRPGEGFDLILGNPPWVSRSRQRDGCPRAKALPADSPLLSWCAARRLPVAQGQLAQGFIWKAPQHLEPGGRVCFLLPHGALFNHDKKALAIQRQWFERHPPDRIVNLSDLRFLLFDGAIKPAIIVRFGGAAPEGEAPDRIDYFVPRADLGVIHAELLALAPEDRMELSRSTVLAALRSDKAPAWKPRLWGTPRDWRFLERLAALPRLGALVDQARDRKRLPEAEWKPWIAGQGFQPLGPGDSGIDDPRPAWREGTRFLKADDPRIDLLLVGEDCPAVAARFGPLRRRPEFEAIFRGPHVIVTVGMRAAYADFDVVFQHAAQGIHGPPGDAPLLMFLAAYLRSPLSHYFLFHTAANWGVERPKVHLEELLRVPFLRPEQTASPDVARSIVETVAAKMQRAAATLPARDGREEAIKRLKLELWGYIADYFGVGPSERILIEDTLAVAMPSATPRRGAAGEIPTIRASSAQDRAAYLALLCQTLNNGAPPGSPRVYGHTLISARGGFGMAVLRRAGGELILQILKPLQGRFWTRTAALNDADAILHARLRPSQPRSLIERFLYFGLDIVDVGVVDQLARDEPALVDVRAER